MTVIRVQHVGTAIEDYETTQRELESIALPMRDFRNDQGRGFQHDGRILLGNACWLHLVHNWNPESRVNRFMTHRGVGLEHLALESDDIEADVKRLRDLEVPIFEDHIFDANDGFEAFVYPDDAIGFTVELIQPHLKSWAYPEDAIGRPLSDGLGVKRLARIGAGVTDVGEACRRFQALFGLAASDDGRISLGNAELQLFPSENIGLHDVALATASLEDDARFLEEQGVVVSRRADGVRIELETLGFPFDLIPVS